MITPGRAQQILDEQSRHFGSDITRFMRPHERNEVRQEWLDQMDGQKSLRDYLVSVARQAEDAPVGAPLPGIRVPFVRGGGEIIHVESLCDNQPLADDGIWLANLRRRGGGVALLRLGPACLPESDIVATQWVQITERDLTEEQYDRLHEPPADPNPGGPR